RAVFFFPTTARTQLYTLSLHDALPISGGVQDGLHVLDLVVLDTDEHGRVPLPQEPARGGQLRGLEPALPENLLQAAGVGILHDRSEEHTSELQSRENLVCRLLLEKKKT